MQRLITRWVRIRPSINAPPGLQTAWLATSYFRDYTTVMQFEWDEAKNQLTIRKHGLDFADAHEIFGRPTLTVLDDRFDMNKPSMTNWERVDALTDDTIDTSDIPPLTEEQLIRGTLRMPGESIAVTVHLDPEVLAWFKTQGPDYERYINAALRIYAEAHKTYHRS